MVVEILFVFVESSFGNLSVARQKDWNEQPDPSGWQCGGEGYAQIWLMVFG
ncbi:hypothetical protein [Epilithonimonas sp. UC225_85]|uniref:hypothetical protein n=1 Tax=Epilithonimonas sp. UC225_85 TaxID=3350167 RepID=UPI0036D2A95D